MMKAAICTQYGAPEVLQISEIPTPQPSDFDIRVKIHATGVNSGDCRIRRADPAAVRLIFGFKAPRQKVLGNMFSGVVDAVGAKVTAFKPGDAVFGSTSLKFGTYAEYLCIPESAAVVHKPDNVSHETAAATPFGAMTALFFLDKAGIRPGSKVLIYGASGAVGSAAVQIAKAMGAEVTAVCSGANTELVRGLGADKVIDYTREDFSQNGPVYDVLFETVGKTEYHQCIAAIKPKGVLLLGSAMLGTALRGMLTNLFGRHKVVNGVAAADKKADLLRLQQLMASGSLKAAIDRSYPLDQIVDAHRYVDGGHKKGNVVLRVG